MEEKSKNFIENAIDKDLEDGVYDTVHTRFPPEPNGYLHIGHAKSILLNYGLAKEYGGAFNLRFDDTNPTKEKEEYVESIKADVKWLGAKWDDRLFFASNYFDIMYEKAVLLIRKGLAYVSELSADEIRVRRFAKTLLLFQIKVVFQVHPVFPALLQGHIQQIGRASCRERV